MQPGVICTRHGPRMAPRHICCMEMCLDDCYYSMPCGADAHHHLQFYRIVQTWSSRSVSDSQDEHRNDHILSRQLRLTLKNFWTVCGGGVIVYPCHLNCSTGVATNTRSSSLASSVLRQPHKRSILYASCTSPEYCLSALCHHLPLLCAHS